MRIFFDTEHDDFLGRPLQLASIGLLREDGQKLYMVSEELRRKSVGPWFRRHVWPTLQDEDKHPLDFISFAVQCFISDATELVTRGGRKDFDLLERMVGPAWFRQTDLERLWVDLDKPPQPKRQGPHHAMADAHFHQHLFHHLQQFALVPA